MIERRRLPSASYHSPVESESWSRCFFAEQPVVIIDENRDAAQIARHVADKQCGSAPFFVMDMPSVIARVDDWQFHLSRVQPYYALRCNADPVLARILADCAKLGFAVSDTQQLAAALELVSANRVIMDCPLWTRKTMRVAGEFNVGTIVIENEKQLMDAISYAPRARLLLAMSLNECRSDNESLSTHKGANVEEIEEVLMTAFELRANVVGVSFDLGFATSASSFYKALREVRSLFSFASRVGLELDTINLGGGFPASNVDKDQRFAEMCAVINTGLDQFFSSLEFPQLNVIATPGRYFAAAAFVLCTNVIGKKALEARHITNDDFDDGVAFVYQTNESIYGSFGCVLMNSQPECIPLVEIADAPQHFGTVLGASLQPGDVAQSLIRCRQLCVGDWLLWRDAGAYTMPIDGVHAVPPVYYFAGSDKWKRIIGLSKNSYTCKTDCCGSDAMDTASDGASDVESLDEYDNDDLTECFDRVFLYSP
ncbi:Pyridoxal-dependent decarboxylase, pyridoxal binding domain protein [Dictyocaulus viviparus]|uniref:Pyridoxal-dependent decarboxylase, pyridoxal binding domain protein n=1 Tax=Dictyocaulus viviparus TaxID=29172 RepID=A0A0D8X7R7_DICVI|nr:Pyridoxal-dependent decarboxylase, pyridoxal binding domain protein [Dictyocaulus viviparus]